MPTRRIARGRTTRLPGRADRTTALSGVLGVLVFGLALCCLPGHAGAKRVTPLVVDRAVVGPSGATPWVSPTGEQLVTYLRGARGTMPLPGLKARIGGGPFSSFEALSPRPGLAPPTAAIGADGTARLLWQAAGAGNLTEQAVRRPGGPPEAASPAGACDGPAAVAVSRSGRTLAACEAVSGIDSSRTGLVGIGQMPSAIAPAVEVAPGAGAPNSDPLVAWGSNGTGIVAFGYREDGSPGQSKIAVRIVAPDGTPGETEVVHSVADPATLNPTGVAVLPNGTAAITADSSNGGLLFTRVAGPGGTFVRTATGEDTARMPSADRWGRLHFLGSKTGGSGGKRWTVRVLDLDGSLREGVPVPTRGIRFEPAENGLQVAPGGNEALVMKSARGFSVFFRSAGPHAFLLPRDLVRTKAAGPGSVTRTPAGDLLLTWEEDAAPGRQRLMLGGWDANGKPVIERLSVPRRAKSGSRIKLSVTATDPMGIRRIVWKLPDNRKLKGASVKARLRKGGVNRIEVSVFDRAGNRTTQTRRVKVSLPGRQSRQGRAGTSGSPRP